jgi:hypothetical protein
MSVSVVPSSAIALIEKTLITELDTAPSTPSAPPTAASTQLTRDLASLLKSLASGNVPDASSSIANVQQDLKTQASPDAATASPLENLLTQIASSLNSTNSTSGSLENLAAYLIQNGQGAGSVVNTTA